MNESHYYDLLGLSENATIADLKKAFHQKAKEYHPDVSPYPDAASKFIEINEAYEYLYNKLELNRTFNNQRINAYSESANDIIEKWMAAERERIRNIAAQHAKMRFRQYKKTAVYRTTEGLNYSLYITTLILGLFVMCGSVLGTFLQWKKNPKIVDTIYLANSLVVFSVGFVMTFFSALKLIINMKSFKKS
jgi:hypothetical protein